jgi:hypothetical protein
MRKRDNSEGKQLLFLKKSNQKNFTPAGAWPGRAFNRHRRRRLKALPGQAPAMIRNFCALVLKALLS